jgi:hypothetical protein
LRPSSSPSSASPLNMTGHAQALKARYILIATPEPPMPLFDGAIQFLDWDGKP